MLFDSFDDFVRESPAHFGDLPVFTRGMHPVAQENHVEIVPGVNPEGRSCETRMPEGVLTGEIPDRAFFRWGIPAQRSAGTPGLVLA